ncbi:MAG TPA: lantibiotic dehydratase [Thermoanaerobaculia bacterium]|nr:lantibiotic dehydratase [Thermoanaerobaculia bacterium]
MRRDTSDFEPSGFFALRSPLLPFDELEAWTEGLEAFSAEAELEDALGRDRARLRSRLQRILERPEIAEAIFVASPGLFDQRDRWRAEPDTRKGKRAEDALVRYFQRMASRPTPFGLFSGCSLGTVANGDATDLRIAAREQYERHSRLDNDYLFALCEDLGRNPGLRAELTYRPNSSIYRAAGRLRYAEARLAGKIRSHHLVALDATPYLEATLARAAEGATPAELAAALVTSDPDGEITLADAAEYVDELIAAQVLVSDLTPAVTGSVAISGVESQLAALPSGGTAMRVLARVRETLTAMDASGVGATAVGGYRAIAEDLRELPTTVELSRLFQVDMIKPMTEARLGSAAIDELQRGLTILHRLSGRSRGENLERFRQDFVERHGDGRWMPLAEVLDDEAGIGFERSALGESSPLLENLELRRPEAENRVAWTAMQKWQTRKLHAAISRGEQEIELTAEDVDALAPPENDPLPDALEVMATLAAASEEDAAAGRFRVLWRSASGPSGARLLGRFCHADRELEARTREHLTAEEKARPDAIFAEIVHTPQGRTGNVIARPVLRGYEIPFLGRSGAPRERQIPLADLQVTVMNGRIVLRSERLGREVIPRMTTAHNYPTGIGIYRFLCALQTQGLAAGLGWNWGPLEASPFLPRVITGRLVLRRARWKLFEDEIKALCSGSATARFAAMRSLKRERRMPRRVLLADRDNELFVDFENVLSVEAFLDVIEKQKEAVLFEFFPGPDELCARGPEGRFVHELIVPFVRSTQSVLPPKPRAVATPAIGIQRSFLPGSEWLFVKLYLGASTADSVLREIVGPIAREALASTAADSWFFLRYSDPHGHLRVRFHGAPRRLLKEVAPMLEALAAPLLSDGRLWRMQFDTYDREVERYGGAHAIGLTERLFHVDSEAVLSIIDLLEGDAGAAVRWHLAICGIDLLLDDLGFDAMVKRTILRQVRDSFFREFGGVKSLRLQLDAKRRAESRALETLRDPLLEPTCAPAGELGTGLAILRNRSKRNAPIIAELRQAEQAGKLTVPIQQMAPSLVHMHVNRLIRTSPRAHELVLYDLLEGLHTSIAARLAYSTGAERELARS